MAERLPEHWLRGPVDGIPAVLQPVAHALLQSRDEVEALMDDFPEEYLWTRPGGVASVGFHLQHLRGVVDRLFTYAQGEGLSTTQMKELLTEREADLPGIQVSDLVRAYREQVDRRERRQERPRHQADEPGNARSDGPVPLGVNHGSLGP